MGMKSLVVDPADPKSLDTWYEVVRSSVTDAFHCMVERERERKQEVRSRGIALKVEEDENAIDYVQFISWCVHRIRNPRPSPCSNPASVQG